MENKEFLSTIEVAKALGVSRIYVFKKIKAGKIKAIKVGRNFVIAKKDLLEAAGAVISEKRKAEISRVVKKAAQEYGRAFKMLGKE